MLAWGLGLPAGCVGPPPAGDTDAPVSVVPEAALAGTWPVEVAPDAARAPFEADPGWAMLLDGRPGDARQAFVTSGNLEGQARASAELAVLSQHAAAVAAWSTLRVYGDEARPEDPPEARCLATRAATVLGVEAPPIGDCLASPVPRFADDERAWTTRGEAPFPRLVLPLHQAPPYRYELTDADGRTFAAVDPAGVLGLAALFRAEAAEGWGPVLTAAAWYPGEADPSVPATPAGLAWRFGGVAGTGGDLLLLATGVPGDSPLGLIHARCQLDLDCVSTEAAAYRAALEAAMDRAAGAPRDYHRRFADRLGLGVYLAGVAVAEARGDEDAAARFRLAALDWADARSPDPRTWLQLAAADARQRNTLRATELVHRSLPFLPGLELARVPLDALHVRVSRSAAPGVPLH